MRKLLVTTFLTLDGVMQAPGGPGEDDSGGFAFGGWSVNYWDDLMGQVMGEAMSKPFDMLLGRRTYDILAAFWPNAPEDEGAKPFNDATKYVASHGRPTLTGALGPDRRRRGRRHRRAQAGGRARAPGARQRQPDPDAAAAQPRGRYRLWVFPVVIGSGKRLFADGTIPAGAQAGRQHGLDDRRRDRHVRAGRRTHPGHSPASEHPEAVIV